MPQKRSLEFKVRALELIEERAVPSSAPAGLPAPASARPSAASRPPPKRTCYNQDRVDRGEAPALSTAEAEEIKKLRREISGCAVRTRSCAKPQLFRSEA